MRLIDLDNDVHVFCGEDGEYEKWNIDTAKTVDAVPVWFIEDAIKLMKLNVQIAMSEGDDESAVIWVTRVAALAAMVGRWKVTEDEE